MFAKKVITSTAPEAAAEATEAVTAETVVANPLAATADGAAGGAAAATTTTGTPAAASSWFAAKPGETAPTPAASSWFAAAPAAGAGGIFIAGTENFRKLRVAGSALVLYIKPTP